jgi:hypothetical protein
MQQRQWAFGAEAEGTTTYFRSDGYQAFVSLLVQDGMTFVTLTEAGRTGAPSIERLEVSR